MDEYSVLKIYISNTDKYKNGLLYEYIVELAKNVGLIGATVCRGIMGYGLSSKHISKSKFWELTDKLPVVIEIIDKTPKIEEFYTQIASQLNNYPKGFLITMSSVEIKLHNLGKK